MALGRLAVVLAAAAVLAWPADAGVPTRQPLDNAGEAAAKAKAKANGARKAPVAVHTVSQKYPHDAVCFTEGLLINGSQPEVFESCGLYGKSYLRRYDLETGKTLQRVAAPKDIFGEGLSLLGSKLFMLTYHHREVLQYDAFTLQLERRHPFPYGQGWGLTTDGCDLLATTGSSYVFRLRLDAAGTLTLVNKVQVMHKNKPLAMLNELEYVTPVLWVNQWHTNTLWRVDPETGACELQVDVRGLYQWSGERTPNGVAYSTQLDEQLLVVTGKQWPQMFGLRLSASDLCGVEMTLSSPPTCAQAPPSACWHRSNASGGLPARGEAGGGANPSLADKVISAASPAPVAALDPTVPPISEVFTAAATALAAMLAVGAVAAPVCIWRQRHKYKRITQPAFTMEL